MRQFRGVSEKDILPFFHTLPTEFSRNLERKKLGIAMGASLYMPGLMPNFSSKLTNKNLKNLVSAIICLEDSISDTDLIDAENNVIRELHLIDQTIDNNILDGHEIPLLFLRVRSVEQLQSLADRLGNTIRHFTGIVFPKCTSSNAKHFLFTLQEINHRESIHLYALPILETKEIIYSETREQELTLLYETFKIFEELILTVRVGGTDFTSLYSQRRSGNRTIYDMKIVSDCLTAILNKFNRYEDSFVVSGPVYEYFEQRDSSILLRNTYSFEEVLWEEIQLDMLNGFHGKTCIHPSQIDIINSAYVVPKELYDDACLIIEKGAKTNGVLRSPTRNKMNEVKPHYSWALKILAQAEIYGVLKEHVTSYDFLQYIKNV